MMMPTASITPKVSRYCISLTANDHSGWTKNRSKLATLITAASTDGQRPKNSATIATPSR